jgi:hypothetical protein
MLNLTTENQNIRVWPPDRSLVHFLHSIFFIDMLGTWAPGGPGDRRRQAAGDSERVGRLYAVNKIK